MVVMVGCILCREIFSCFLEWHEEADDDGRDGLIFCFLYLRVHFGSEVEKETQEANGNKEKKENHVNRQKTGQEIQKMSCVH